MKLYHIGMKSELPPPPHKKEKGNFFFCPFHNWITPSFYQDGNLHIDYLLLKENNKQRKNFRKFRFTGIWWEGGRERERETRRVF